jgi:hypothetical protein
MPRRRPLTFVIALSSVGSRAGGRRVVAAPWLPIGWPLTQSTGYREAGAHTRACIAVLETFGVLPHHTLSRYAHGHT